MFTRTVLIGMVATALAVPVAAAGSTPQFKNPNLVARKMEAHYNGAAYKSRIAKVGGKVTRRVLCAYDGYFEVECSGRLSYKGKAWTAHWSLAKRTATRAKLTWTFESMKGYMDGFDHDSEIVKPSAFGLRTF